MWDVYKKKTNYFRFDHIERPTYRGLAFRKKVFPLTSHTRRLLHIHEGEKVPMRPSKSLRTRKIQDELEHPLCVTLN